MEWREGIYRFNVHENETIKLVEVISADFFLVFESDSYKVLLLSNQRWGIFTLSQMTKMLPLKNEHLINQNKRLKLKLTLQDIYGPFPT